jgi:diaminopimelate epimerase/ribosomal protein S18 acetylase RimI-like enzyme
MQFKYRIFDPNGNTTALVIGHVSDDEKKQLIQKRIKKLSSVHIEQVGFVNDDFSTPHLIMTGGEFCGNATRFAAYLYQNGSPGKISIQVSGVKGKLEAGVTDSLEAWTQMPVINVKKINDDLYWVELEGISHLVVSKNYSVQYLTSENLAGSAKELIRLAKSLLKSHNLYHEKAYGVIFTETVSNKIKIHPCVFVPSADTEEYESSCGSGSAAVGLVESLFLGKSVELPLLQKNDSIINVSAFYEKREARIIGGVEMGEELIGNMDDYRILQIKNTSDLWNILDKNTLHALFDNCFGNEKFDPTLGGEDVAIDDVVSDFEKFTEDGVLLFYQHEKTSEIVGFAAALPLHKQSDAWNTVNAFLDDAMQYWYFSELGISEKYREFGLGKILTRKLLFSFVPSNKIVMRARVDNEKTLNLNKSLGFTILQDSQGLVIKQMVPVKRKRTGKEEADERLFLTLQKP